MRRHVYLDWNATTPLHEDAACAMRDAIDDAWANPASVHGPGRRARERIEEAREAIAALVGFDARDVVLTSGGTEANNLALAHAFPEAFGRPPPLAPVRAPGGSTPTGKARAKLEAPAPRGPGALVVSRAEHPSVTRPAEELARRGVAVAWIDPRASGAVHAEDVARAIDELAAQGREARLVALQAVNHETGVIQPIALVAEIARARGALLHVDAVQAVGRLDPSTWAGADLVAVASHKIRGPKGIGALVTRPGTTLVPVLVGGAQERGLRPGTQDPIAAAGFAVAARRAQATPERYAALALLRDRLEASLVDLARELGVRVERNGEGPRAPHASNLAWDGWRGDELAAALDLEGVALSSGSACAAGTSEPSDGLVAMVGAARAKSAVRITLGESTSDDDVEAAIAAFRRVLSRTRSRGSSIA